MKLRMVVSSKRECIFFVDENNVRFNWIDYYWSSDFFDDGVACVAFYKNGFPRKQYLRNDGTFISDECFIKGEDGFSDGSVKVMREDGEWYYLDYNGNFHTSKP